MARRRPLSSLPHALGWLVVLGTLVGWSAWALRHADAPPSAVQRGQVESTPAATGRVTASSEGTASSATPPEPAPRNDAAPDALTTRVSQRPPASSADVGRAPSASAASPITPLPDDTARLAARRLTLPVQGVRAAQLADTFSDARADGKRRHDAIDIMAPTGTPVLAVEDGRIAKLFFSQGGGGITVYQFDPGEQYAYYYAHLDRYADGLQEGQSVRRGQVIGYVGSSGNARADAPHLHFAITRLGPQKQWWKGEALNPYPVLTAR